MFWMVCGSRPICITSPAKAWSDKGYTVNEALSPSLTLPMFSPTLALTCMMERSVTMRKSGGACEPVVTV